MQIFPASNKKKLVILPNTAKKGLSKFIFNKFIRFENGVSESSKDIVSESPQQGTLIVNLMQILICIKLILQILKYL